MGCNDYYDPARDRENERWRTNTALLDELGFATVFVSSRGLYGSAIAALCPECSAMVWCGDLRREDDLPWARAHNEWHQQLARDLYV